MPIRDLLEELAEDFRDFEVTKFSFSKTQNVPGIDDSGFTFGKNEEKKGKIIQTCVLFADIRDSVSLTKKNTAEEMGKIYTAFTKVVLKAAHYHGGVVRNIIGDRVMVIFPEENCFVNAVECAITINHSVNRLAGSFFRKKGVKCGIGIDFGEMKVIKVGLPKKGEERSENRNFTWVGKPANIASRLTDVANKEVEEVVYVVTKKPYNPLFLGGHSTIGGLLGAYGIANSHVPNLDPIEIEMSAAEFAKELHTDNEGKLGFILDKFISMKREVRPNKYPPILVTASVRDGLNQNSASHQVLKKNLFPKLEIKIKDVSETVYGGEIFWIINSDHE